MDGDVGRISGTAGDELERIDRRPGRRLFSEAAGEMENGGPVWRHRIGLDSVAILRVACMAKLDDNRSRLVSHPLNSIVGVGVRALGDKETKMTLTQVQSLAIVATGSILFTVFAGSLVEWSKWIARQWNGEKISLAVQEPQATVGLIDLLATFTTLAALFFAAAVLWTVLGLPSVAPKATEPIDSIVINSSSESLSDTSTGDGSLPNRSAAVTQNQFLYAGFAMSAQIICVLLVTLFVVGRTGCTIKKLGWRTDQVAGDLVAGLKCFIMMSPVILILNAILQGVTKTPYEHPVQEMIKQYPWLLGIAFWQAAIVAPISEEFGFRVLLIGWFESIHYGRNKMFALLFGMNQQPTAENEATPQEWSSFSTPVADPSNSYTATSILIQSAAPLSVSGQAEASHAAVSGEPPWWPVLLSGTLFGLAHFSYGVSWVPLIVFGIVLGRLYQLRQSILPVIFVHFLFNGMNVTLLGLSLLLPANTEVKRADKSIDTPEVSADNSQP